MLTPGWKIRRPPLPDFQNPAWYETMTRIARENRGEKYLVGMLPMVCSR